MVRGLERQSDRKSERLGHFKSSSTLEKRVEFSLQATRRNDARTRIRLNLRLLSKKINERKNKENLAKTKTRC